MNVMAAERKILILDDNTPGDKLVFASLKERGYQVSALLDGNFDPDTLRQSPPDVILIDIKNPIEDALQKIYAIRDFCSVPVIGLLTAEIVLDTADDVYLADHILFKPFTLRQLEALIHICLRERPFEERPQQKWPFVDRRKRTERHGRAADIAGASKPGKLAINLDVRDVFMGDKPLGLSPKEFSLFKLLASRPGGIVTEGEIMNTLWPRCRSVTDAEIRQYIFRLRRKIERNPNMQKADCIQTIKGRGYRLNVESKVDDSEERPDGQAESRT